MSAERDGLREAAARLVSRFAAQNLRIVTAESCTGGMVAAFITDVAGSSAVFERGLVTYSNEAKQDLLGVDPQTLARHGAASAPVAAQMAAGALRTSLADVAVAITGIAGPGGGSPGKPIGLVHFACARGTMLQQREERFGDLGREAIRLASVRVAFEMLEQASSDQA